MTDTIYSCKQQIGLGGDVWCITKFTDGNVESSYTTTYDSCDCPAGVRPSCRHRQMLPQMIAADIVNTEFFWDFDLGRAVDFSGTLKSNIDAMNELAMEDEDVIPHADITATEVDQRITEYDGPMPGDGIIMIGLDNLLAVHNTIAEAVGEAQHSEPYTQRHTNAIFGGFQPIEGPHSPTDTTTEFDSVDGGSIPSVAAKTPWRRI